MEFLSIALKNPHAHSSPHAVPVYLSSGDYRVVAFDGSSSVIEFCKALANDDPGLRPPAESGFALFSDDPLDQEAEHALHPEDKICDVLSRWETALRERGQGRFDGRRAVRLSYKRRLSLRTRLGGETERERALLVRQAASDIARGRFPVNKELAVELAALAAQMTTGDLPTGPPDGSPPPEVTLRARTAATNVALEKFFPARYLEAEADRQEHGESLTRRWSQLRGRSSTECARIFLNCARRWPFFGASLFDVKVLLYVYV